MKKLSLIEVLEGLEDERRELSVLYPLHEVLFILLTAVICGATSYAKVEIFGHEREEWLRKYLDLENGIPDAGTFRYILMKLDPAKLHTVFVEWMRSAVEKVTGVVAVDGKQARRTGDSRQRPLHVVSAFSSEARLVLGDRVRREEQRGHGHTEASGSSGVVGVHRDDRRHGYTDKDRGEDTREGRGVHIGAENEPTGAI